MLWFRYYKNTVNDEVELFWKSRGEQLWKVFSDLDSPQVLQFFLELG